MPSYPTDRLLRLPEVKRLTGFSATSTIYRLMAAGEFPAPVKIGSRAVAWPALAVAEWRAKRPSARKVADVDAAELERDLFGPEGLEGYKRRMAKRKRVA
jgi:prophage regulatory protein